MAKKEKVEIEPIAPAPPEVIEPGDPLPDVVVLPDVAVGPVDDEPEDDFDDPKPGPKRNIAYVGRGEAPDQLSLNDGGTPLTVRFRHDTARQRAGFYHRRAALIIADARDSKGKRLYKAFREDKGA
jgi:hypothetical protein